MLDRFRAWRQRRRQRRWAGGLTAVWYNVGDGAADKKRRDLTGFASKGAHLIFLAECSDRVELLESWCREHGWFYWPGDGSPGAAATPVLIRPDVLPAVSLLRTTEACPAADVGGPGAGPDRQKRKVINEVVVRRRWKIGVWRRPDRFLSGHWLPSVDRKQLPNAGRRRLLWRRHARAVLELAGRGFRLARTWIVGDFNTEWDSDLCHEFGAAGFVCLPTGPTHGHRTIDFWLLRAGRKRPTRRQVKRWVVRVFTVRASSDHNAVVLETN